MDKTFVSLDEAVATGMTLLPAPNSMDKNIARQWAYLALRNIGPTNHWFAECHLVPSDERSFKKPNDMWKAIDIALYDANGCELRYSFKGNGTRIHSGRIDLITEGTYDPNFGAAIDLSEDPYYFHLGSNGGGVASATLKYWKLPVDVSGLPVIPEGFVLAIALFIRWMYAIRVNENQADRQLSEASYKVERAKARAEGNMPSGIELEQLAKEWGSLIGAPMFKTF